MMHRVVPSMYPLVDVISQRSKFNSLFYPIMEWSIKNIPRQTKPKTQLESLA